MYITDESNDFIDVLLADAQILTDYDRAQVPTAADRIVRARRRARRELDLTCARVLNDAPPQNWLCRLDDTNDVEGEGQLYFACLLHLIGNEHGARFWWKFAAGSGLYTAAHCLALHYESAGSPKATHWLLEADSLFVPQGECLARPAPTTNHRVLADHVAKLLLEQCRLGVRVELPGPLEEKVKREGIEHTDVPSFGEIVTPSPKLCGVLSAA